MYLNTDIETDDYKDRYVDRDIIFTDDENAHNVPDMTVDELSFMFNDEPDPTCTNRRLVGYSVYSDREEGYSSQESSDARQTWRTSMG
uniref:Bestrophin homolog n=1 Tax=Rhabditophanes sp. KR3021 TaxID=114890 RepID=A0AC35U426_9BILA